MESSKWVKYVDVGVGVWHLCWTRQVMSPIEKNKSEGKKTRERRNKLGTIGEEKNCLISFGCLHGHVIAYYNELLLHKSNYLAKYCFYTPMSKQQTLFSCVHVSGKIDFTDSITQRHTCIRCNIGTIYCWFTVPEYIQKSVQLKKWASEAGKLGAFFCPF